MLAVIAAVQPGGPAIAPQDNSPEIMMRAASYYYLAQTWPQRRRETRPGALPRAGYQGRHVRPHSPRRRHPGRELTALARRVLAALRGTSQPA
jgi:hypothetical protein